MSYIGKSPAVGNFVKLDAISTSSTNTYNLTLDSVAFTPESANHMLVSLNGVIQAPLTSFSVSGSTITFLPSSGTLSSSDSIDFIMVYGNVLDIGTPSDSTVTNAKTNFVSTSSSAGLQIKGDNTTAGTLQLNCEQNSHGIKLRSPAHSSGQSYTIVYPTSNITAGKFLKVESVSGSGATGVGQLSFADAGGNSPSFMARRSNSQTSVADVTETKVLFPTQVFDTGGCYDESTSKFTVPSGEAGKYFLFCGANAYFYSTTGWQLNIHMYKNGSKVTTFSAYDMVNSTQIVYGYQVQGQVILDLAVGDYIEVYIYGNSYNNGAFSISGGDAFVTRFGGFKLGGV